MQIVVLGLANANAASCTTIASRYITREMPNITRDKLDVIFASSFSPGGRPPPRRHELLHERPTDY